MKTCTKCEVTKHIKCFNKDSSKKDNLHSSCKECEKILKKAYRRTKEGLITNLYGHQIERSKKNGYRLPDYSKQEFKDWLYSQELFHLMFNEWKMSGYEKRLTPSIDRLNDYIHYCFGNIQLVTWEENNIKGQKDRRNGINNKVNKSVSQYSKDGKFIAKYHSRMEASRRTNVPQRQISQCCSGGIKNAGGYIWSNT